MNEKRESKKQRKKRRKGLIEKYYKDNPPETYNELLTRINSSMKRNDGDMEKVVEETEERFSIVLKATGWRDYCDFVVEREGD